MLPTTRLRAAVFAYAKPFLILRLSYHTCHCKTCPHLSEGKRVRCWGVQLFCGSQLRKCGHLDEQCVFRSDWCSCLSSTSPRVQRGRNRFTRTRGSCSVSTLCVHNTSQKLEALAPPESFKASKDSDAANGAINCYGHNRRHRSKAQDCQNSTQVLTIAYGSCCLC